MGRGRQKAKQTKVARELKYHSSSIDVHALQRELSGNSTDSTSQPQRRAVEVDEDDDPYASYADYAAEDDDEPAGGYAAPSRRR